MKSLTKNPILVAAILIFAVIVVAYNLFFKSEVSSFTPDPEVTAIGTQVVATYEALEKVKLDQSLFSTDSYRFLSDFSIEVPEQPVGRNNPFAEIGA